MSTQKQGGGGSTTYARLRPYCSGDEASRTTPGSSEQGRRPTMPYSPVLCSRPRHRFQHETLLRRPARSLAASANSSRNRRVAPVELCIDRFVASICRARMRAHQLNVRPFFKAWPLHSAISKPRVVCGHLLWEAFRWRPSSPLAELAQQLRGEFLQR